VIKSRRKVWARHVARMGEERRYRGFWWGSLREREHLEEPGRGKHDIKMDLQEVGCRDMDWIKVA